MAKLKVKVQGRVLQEYSLSENREYSAGRSDSCDIHLPSEKSVSRQHFTLVGSDGVWTIVKTSRYGELVVNGDLVDQISISENCTISIFPVELELLVEPPVQEAPEASKGGSSQLPAIQGAHHDENDFEGNLDKTFIGEVGGIPHVRLLDAFGGTKSLLQLEGKAWIGGRDSSCDIHIEDQRVSRRQFEMTFEAGSYYLRDLGSVNGTLVNGQPAGQDEPTQLKSGDIISILDCQLQFELRDPSFEDKLAGAKLPPAVGPLVPLGPGGFNPPAPPSPYVVGPYAGGYPPGQYFPQPEEQPKTFWQRIDWKDRQIQIRAAIIVLILFGGLFKVTEGMRGDNTEVAQNLSPFDKLTPEQQSLVRHSYQLAKNLYMQGRYEMAHQEVAKIHDLIPEYEDSREIEANCLQAFELKRQRDLIERQAREQAEQERRLQQILAECREKVSPNVQSEEIERCLLPALVINPEAAQIQAIRSEVAQIIESRQRQAAERAAHQDRVRRMQNLFNAAERVDREGKALEAIRAYRRVVNSSLPDPGNLKQRSSRRIASIQEQIADQTSRGLGQAGQQYDRQNFREAIIILNQVLEIDPDNSEAKDMLESIRRDLTRQMQVFYQEAILEESLGRVPEAIEKWKRIRELSVPDEAYYRKSEIKLRSYGAH